MDRIAITERMYKEGSDPAEGCVFLAAVLESGFKENKINRETCGVFESVSAVKANRGEARRGEAESFGQVLQVVHNSPPLHNFFQLL